MSIMAGAGRHDNCFNRGLLLLLAAPAAVWVLFADTDSQVLSLPLGRPNQGNNRDSTDPCNKDEYCVPETMVSNPDNCTTYFVCTSTGWIEMPCDENLLFNPEIENCDFPYNVVCPPPCPPYTGPTTTEGPTISPGLCDYVECPCTPGKKYADVSSCKHYFECGIFDCTRRKCDDPLVFNIYDSNCTYVTPDVDCDYRCTTTAAPTTLPPTSTSFNVTSQSSASHRDTTLPPTSTSSDVTSQTSVSHRGKTPTVTSTSFNVTSQSSASHRDTIMTSRSTAISSMKPGTSTTQGISLHTGIRETHPPTDPPTTSASTADPCAVPESCTTEGDRLPDPYACNKYYVCDNGTNQPQTCPPDTFFDKDGLSCGNSTDITCADCSPLAATETPGSSPPASDVPPSLILTIMLPVVVGVAVMGTVFGFVCFYSCPAKKVTKKRSTNSMSSVQIESIYEEI